MQSVGDFLVDMELYWLQEHLQLFHGKIFNKTVQVVKITPPLVDDYQTLFGLQSVLAWYSWSVSWNERNYLYDGEKFCPFLCKPLKKRFVIALNSGHKFYSLLYCVL